VERGLVLVGGAVADKPARLVAASDPVELRTVTRFVSRGGEKLQAALDRFAVDVDGRRFLDAGASTGGFTDCLLQSGARHVVAVDVGHGQLDERLRRHPHVVNLERTDIRDLRLVDLEGVPVDGAAVDLSFISLTSVMPAIMGEVVAPGAPVVLLVKPQFEAGRVAASKGKGVIRDPAVHRTSLARVAQAVGGCGGHVAAAMPSPLRGRSGNVEFFLLARRSSGDGAVDGVADTGELDALLDAVVAEAHATRQDGRAWP
jgi:23S rRNA (cytidine1920-2'-O)/16S rRNA (cytidine1409-2'-O)-methyltransferase